jgi:lipopolysaccharide/colanic/teichoic acid biosynthesis glycosyltransferase
MTHTALAAPTLTPYVLALTIITILGFAGAYPQRRSPVDIAETEGLMRGIGCVAILLAVGCFSTRTIPGACALVTASFAVTSLAIQREIAHIFKRSARLAALVPAQSSFPAGVVPASSSSVVSEYPSCFGLSYGESPAGFLLKRFIDVVLSAGAIVLVTPLLLLVAAIIKIDSRGPVLIRQRRIGRNGRPFSMWKFRSMHAGVERYAPSPVSEADPRLTRFGSSLRRLSIDELPQLFNVVTGDMSLVGPRPEMPFIVNKYTAQERLRLNAIPGITGLWQISPARAMPIHANLEFDLFYIEHRSVFLDFAILLRTVTAVMRGIGAT